MKFIRFLIILLVLLLLPYSLKLYGQEMKQHRGPATTVQATETAER